MKKNKMIWVLAVVLLATAAVAVWHLSTRTEVPEGKLLVTYEGKETTGYCYVEHLGKGK